MRFLFYDDYPAHPGMFWTRESREKFVWAGLQIFVVVLIMFLSACAQTSYRQQVLHEIQLRAQERLIHRARVDFEQHRYQAAVERLDRLLTEYPESPLRVEMQWLLARSYQEVGNRTKAKELYQKIIDSASRKSYHDQARRRMGELDDSVIMQVTQGQNVRAVALDLHQLSTGTYLGTWLQSVVRDKMNTLLIDIGCDPPNSTVRNDQSAQFSHRFIQQRILTLLHPMVTMSHQRGLRVFAGVNLRCLGNFAPEDNHRWRDGRYDRVTQTIQHSNSFDLFHADYQKFLDQFLSALAGIKLDGLVFLSSQPLGRFDGFTTTTMESFGQTFGIRLDVPAMFSGLKGGERGQENHVEGERPASTYPVAPEFWRWAGWKSRARLMTMHSLMSKIQEQHPRMVFGLELHLEGVEDPVAGLINFSEDFYEAAQGKFSFFTIQGDSSQESSVQLRSSRKQKAVVDVQKGIEQMIKVVGSPEKIWVAIQRKQSAPSLSALVRTASSTDSGFPDGVGIVYDQRSFP